MAKAVLWACTDAEERKRGERTGLDTLVVHAVNVGCSGERRRYREEHRWRRRFSGPVLTLRSESVGSEQD